MYQGHKSKNAWNVALWISNDESLYNLAIACIRSNRTKDMAAEEMLKHLPSRTPDGMPYTFTSVRAAMIELDDKK